MTQISIQSIEDKVALVVIHEDGREPLALQLDPEAAERIGFDLLRTARLADRAAAKAGADRLTAECQRLALVTKVIFEHVDIDGILTLRIRREFPELLPPAPAEGRPAAKKPAARKPARKKGKR